MSDSGSEIRFFRTIDGVRVAYRVVGRGPVVVAPPWWLNHLEVLWESPDGRSFFERLADHFTVVLYDKPGCGLSDRVPAAITTAAQARTLESLVDHLALSNFSMFAHCDAGAAAVAYAARHPERVDRLVLFASMARMAPSSDRDLAAWEASKVVIRADWNVGSALIAHRKAPNRDPNFYAWYARYFRESADPETVIAIVEHMARADVTHLLGEVRAETLVLHRREDPTMPFDAARELAGGIPGARFIPLEGPWHALWEGEMEDVLNHTLAFLSDAGDAPLHRDGRPRVHLSGTRPSGLSDREREVLALIASGKTNAQIAEKLTITTATASKHVHNILAKLGMSRRSEAAAWAAANGLTTEAIHRSE